MRTDDELEKALNELSQASQQEIIRNQQEVARLYQIELGLEEERQAQKQLSNVKNTLSLGLSVVHFPVVVCLYDKNGQHIKTFDSNDRVDVNKVHEQLISGHIDNLHQTFPTGKWIDQPPVVDENFCKVVIQLIYDDNTVWGYRTFQWTVIEYLLLVGDVFETDKVRPQSIINNGLRYKVH